jgi:hypothetical protein
MKRRDTRASARICGTCSTCSGCSGFVRFRRMATPTIAARSTRTVVVDPSSMVAAHLNKRGRTYPPGRRTSLGVRDTRFDCPRSSKRGGLGAGGMPPKPPATRQRTRPASSARLELVIRVRGSRELAQARFGGLFHPSPAGLTVLPSARRISRHARSASQRNQVPPRHRRCRVAERDVRGVPWSRGPSRTVPDLFPSYGRAYGRPQRARPGRRLSSAVMRRMSRRPGSFVTTWQIPRPRGVFPRLGNGQLPRADYKELRNLSPADADAARCVRRGTRQPT